MEFARNLCSKSCKQVLMQGCSQIMNNTIKRDNIWVMQIRKDRCFIPEVHQYADKHNKKQRSGSMRKNHLFLLRWFPSKTSVIDYFYCSISASLFTIIYSSKSFRTS